MSDPTVTTAATPTITVDPATNTPVQPPAPAPAASGKADGEPDWLPARLERERRSLLKSLGVDDPEVAKKAISAAKAAEEAQKTEAQRAADEKARADKYEQQLRSKDEALSAYAKDQMTGLTDAQRKAVMDVAGDDAALQLKTISALRPTWASAAAPAATAATQAAQVQDTAPGRTAPKDEGSNSTPVDDKAVWEELKKTNPIVAARFALQTGLFNK